MSLPDYMNPKLGRPFGISLLSILHFIGGLSLLGFATWGAFILRNPQVKERLSALGLPIPLLAAGIGLLVCLSLGASIGMWNGARWGWYLGSFNYAYAIARNLTGLFAIRGLFDAIPAAEIAKAPHGIAFYYTKFGFGLLVSLLLYLYFFKGNVREFFGLREARKWPVVAIRFFLCVDIVLAVNAWAKFAQ